jgi:hypothetical protein
MLARSEQLDEPLARSLFETSQVLGFNAAGVGIGTFAVATAAAAMQDESLLPRWLATLTALVGAALFTPLCRLALGPAVALLGVVASAMSRRASAS